MMWDIRPRRVLLAVESADCEPAIRYAVDEARRRRCGVHVVHVVPTVSAGPGTDATVIVNGELRRLSQTILGDVANAVERRLDDEDLTVSTELCHGPVASTLVHESRYASVVVLQHRGGTGGSTPVLSVTYGVAGRSHAPVIAVPVGWQPPDPDTEKVVTVGLGDDPVENDRLVELASEAAERMGATVRTEDARDVDALLGKAEDTTLFVVGRRHPRLPLSPHLGPEARTLLRRSPVPVMVVDPGGDDQEAGHDLATAAVP